MLLRKEFTFLAKGKKCLNKEINPENCKNYTKKVF